MAYIVRLRKLNHQPHARFVANLSGTMTYIAVDFTSVRVLNPVDLAGAHLDPRPILSLGEPSA
jgi:hypothetical protein